MKSTKLLTGLSAIGLSLAIASPALAMGDYLRKEKDTIKVVVKEDKLYCTRAEDGFEMCHGMMQEGDEWKGDGMKHPDMPGFMTFNGTVIITENTLSIKGCAVGNSMCDSEVWTKIVPPAEGAETGETAPAATE